MKIGNFTVALLAMFAIACVPPQSKGPKKSSNSISDGGKTDTPGDTSSNNVVAPSNNTVAPTNNSTNNENIVDGPVCGDGFAEGDEACDGNIDASCQDLGFDGGFTACSSTCEVDTTGCTRVTCGDGVIQDDETCDDGAENGAYDTCDANCSGLAQYCGDNTVNGPEACDGAPPSGVTCQSMGFDNGTIMCGSGCQIDTSACSTCGDGVRESGEACDDGSLNGTYGNCNALCTGLGATCGDGVRNGPEACDGAQLGGTTCAALGAGRGTPTCNSSCDFDIATCSLAPAAGDVIVSEIMQNPAISLDNDGEYFEVYNTTGAALDLDGCTVESATSSGPESFVITDTLLVPGGGYAVLARSTNAPFVADYVYGSDVNLNNSIDELAIICPQPGGGSEEIDRVSYDDGLSFPDPEGASMSLNPGRMNASQNDFGSNWCQSTSTFGVGDRGTPGAPNDVCPSGN